MARRGRRFALGAVMALLVVVGAGGAAYWYMTRDALADPSTVDLPEPAAENTAVRDFFAGPGAPLVAFLDETDALGAEPTKAECTELGVRLDPIGSPGELVDLAATTPDPGIRDAATNHLGAVGRYLAVCGTGADMTDDVEQARFSATVLGRLLEREGVR